MFELKDVTKNKDITPFLVSLEWSGDLNQAGRKLSFNIAYTTNKKDKSWKNLTLELGDKVELIYVDNETKQQYKIFHGIIFLQNRNSESFTMQFCAYDNLIYLAKSKMTSKYSNVKVADIITNVCNTLGVTVGNLCEDCSKYNADFVADEMTGSEIIKKALDIIKAWTGWSYNTYISNDNGVQKLNVVRADTVIDNFKITDITNLESVSHSSSIEDMRNQVVIVDSKGQITGYLKNDEDITKFGLLQDVYKIDKKQDTASKAKSMLKKIKENSSLTAIGNYQCISGFAVEVQEEQISGKFLIESDSHTIQDNVHKMTLTLSYISLPSNSNTSTVTKSNDKTAANKGNGGTGKMNVNENYNIAAGQWVGAVMDNHKNGCVEAVTKFGSNYSPFLANECNNGVVNVNQLVSDSGSNCIDFDASKLAKGDTIVYGDNDHVVTYDGNGGYIGNSSSQDCIVHGSDYGAMDGLYPTKIIKTSKI